MFNPSSKPKPSPAPGWATLQEPTSSDGEIEIIEVKKSTTSATAIKKRKGNGERDPSPSHEGAGPSTKRPRHSTSGVGLNKMAAGPSDLGASPSGGNGANAGGGKHSKVLPIPNFSRPSILSAPAFSSRRPVSSPSKATKQTTLRFGSKNRPGDDSTASALAALYPPPPPNSVDPDIARWRGQYQNQIVRSPRDIQTQQEREKLKPDIGQTRDKGKGKAVPPPESPSDSSDVGVSSSAGPIRNTGVRKYSGKMAVGPGGSMSASIFVSRRTSSANQAAAKTDSEEEQDDGPLYVNDRRQIARKTVNSLKPNKIHQFDRPLSPGNSGSGSLLSSSPGESQSPSDEGNITGESDKSVAKLPSTARKSAAGKKPIIPLSIKGREKARIPDDVIVITSSEDESPAMTSNSSPSRPTVKSSGKMSLSTSKPLSKSKREDINKRHTTGSMETIAAAYNKIFEGQQKPTRKTSSGSNKPPVQDFIDLTLEDSDEGKTAKGPQKSKESSPAVQVKTEKEPALGAQPAEPATIQILPSPPPLTPPPVIAPTPTTAPLLPNIPTDPLAGTSKLETTPRPRSVPTVSVPDVPIPPMQSQSARTSPTASSEKSVRRRPMLPTRRKSHIFQSPDSDELEAADEREVAEAMTEDIPTSASEDRMHLSHDLAVPSSSNVSSTRASPDLIPPLRGSMRRSSTSSADIAPMTDAESPPASSASPEPEDAIEVPTYGGFKALTWENHRRDIKNFHFKHYSAKDIPTSLPDSINRLSEYTRREAGVRDVFQAFILENICDDEAGAPEIEIINDVDAEPSPVFEFNYSNRMWYGEGVSMPDYSKLRGCDCVGRCDPKSQTCACAIKTRSYLDVDGCVYEKNGRLKYPRYPIFECNDLCSCDDDCRNRVVQHGRKVQLSVRKTLKKGWGVFNGPKRLQKGTFLGIYAGELLTDEQGEVRGRYYNNLGKSYLFDIDFWHLKKDCDPDEWHNKYVVDAFHAGNFTRFLNHSCEPNARLFPCYINEPDVEKPLLVVFSNKDVPPYEEICFNYMGSYSEDEDDGDDGEDDGEDDEPLEPKGEKREGAVYRPCMCGAKKCKGVMWN